MSNYDLIIRNATLVLPQGLQQADIAIADEHIAAIMPELEGSVQTSVDAEGLYVFPGLIDIHVHCNEPGRTDWEGFASATQALAAGGVTTFFDMPLNAHPPTLDRNSFQLKLAAAHSCSMVDCNILAAVFRKPDIFVADFLSFISISAICCFKSASFCSKSRSK